MTAGYFQNWEEQLRRIVVALDEEDEELPLIPAGALMEQPHRKSQTVKMAELDDQTPVIYDGCDVFFDTSALQQSRFQQSFQLHSCLLIRHQIPAQLFQPRLVRIRRLSTPISFITHHRRLPVSKERSQP